MDQKQKHEIAYNHAVSTTQFLLITIEKGSTHETQRFFEVKKERDREATRYYHLGDGIAKYNPDDDFESQWDKFCNYQISPQLGIAFGAEPKETLAIGEVKTMEQGQMS